MPGPEDARIGPSPWPGAYGTYVEHVTEGLHGDAASRVAGIIFGTGVSIPLAKAGGDADE